MYLDICLISINTVSIGLLDGIFENYYQWTVGYKNCFWHWSCFR